MSALKRSPAPVAAGSGAGSPKHRAADSSPPIDRLLAGLDGFKQSGAGRWIARCPAHEDRHPSLSIRETSDGTILLHCWAGCSAADIVAAAGLSLADLFPNKPENHAPLRPRDRWDRGDVWQLLVHEAGIAAIAAADAAAGRPVSPADAERVGLAADRLSDAVRTLGVRP